MDLKEEDKMTRTGFFRLRTRNVVDTCKHDNEPSGSITCKQFLD